MGAVKLCELKRTRMVVCGAGHQEDRWALSLHVSIGSRSFPLCFLRCLTCFSVPFMRWETYDLLQPEWFGRSSLDLKFELAGQEYRSPTADSLTVVVSVC